MKLEVAESAKLNSTESLQKVSSEFRRFFWCERRFRRIHALLHYLNFFQIKYDVLEFIVHFSNSREL